jgi:Tfp pilus assembly protein PilF
LAGNFTLSDHFKNVESQRNLMSMRPILVLLLAAGCTTSTFAQQQLPPGTTDPDAQAQSAPDPLVKIEEKISQQDYTGARTLLDAYLTTHANDARAIFDSGFIDDALGKDDAAAASYRRAIKIDPKQFEAHLALGLLLARLNQNDEARAELETATKLQPAEPDLAAQGRAWRALAQLDRNSNPAAAQQALLQALKITPETPDDTLLTAEIAEAAGDTETAESAYRRVLGQQPNSAPAIAGLAHLLLSQKKYTEAEPLLRSALQNDADDPALNAQLAATLLAQDKNNEALDLLQKAHQKTPANPQLSHMLADALMATGDAAGAIDLYKRLLQSQPNNTEMLVAYGQALIRQQKYQDAISVFEQAAHLDQNDADAWGGLAFAASEAHQPSLTLQALSMRSKLVADTPPTYFLRATAYDNLHQTKAAIDAYRQFLSSAAGKFPDQEWQAKQRLAVLEKMR